MQSDYAALSYVWGASPPTVTASSSAPADANPAAIGLPDTIPMVVRDAIKATLEMGVSYLWVDRYCIRSNNTEQIRRMDLIYSHAFFTIVAAAGSGPDHGLPGVGTRHRQQQPAVKLSESITLVSTMPHPEISILSSTWNNRGWS